ncbi:pyridoxamine 5'-phosphate oxidase family protein [Synechococcales cyanobacterium C]|uniref:Pyridoxamine 5'-phosphate oxidase family protein n=1 Tax=Petrachloros mirabilis ULC683 TaxID=2781853 RepID=A0A8K1ZXZ4_9CYAN|nr:pyridoxamine 5'-phosphate oxidase family protein [Petrachloros mirabilis]NCJ06166.1 pyridoxamine 5'-phosphate oxidase family protein [Petrachloros mirabilis ULC683]
MAKFYPQITESLQSFIQQQHLFFTATAPVQGRVNLSPKGMDTFRCLSPQEVAYLDLTGSGNETSAHLVESGRLTIMFCSFTAEPLILRLYGQGQVIRPRDRTWSLYAPHFELLPGTRQIIAMAIDSVQTSCGYAVPLYEYQGERDKLKRWAEAKGDVGLAQYWQDKNQVSIDGLPTGLLVD